MKELKVGERVTITLEVIESDGSCKGCFFLYNGVCTRNFDAECCLNERSDGKDVIFK